MYLTRDAADDSHATASAVTAPQSARPVKPVRAPRAKQDPTPVVDAQPDDTAATDAATAPAAVLPDQTGVVRAVKGVVVDRATGRPLAGARVLLCYVMTDSGGVSWHGDDADDHGRFDCSFDEKDDLSAGHMELRVRKAGYEDVFRAAEKGDMRIELVARTHAAEPGRVVGLAVDLKGLACPGRLLVEAMDDFGAYQAQWTRADAAGTFVLEGVPAGHWRLHAESDADGPYVDVLVPERGEARVQLRTEPPMTDKDESTVSTLERAVGNLDDIRRRIDEIAQSSPSDVKRQEEDAEHLRAGVESMRTRVARGRDVVVAGLPAGSAGAVARVSPKTGRNWFWRARVDGAGVTFADLPPGAYVLRIEGETGLADAGAFEVPADGEGPLEIRFSAAK